MSYDDQIKQQSKPDPVAGLFGLTVVVIGIVLFLYFGGNLDRWSKSKPTPQQETIPKVVDDQPTIVVTPESSDNIKYPGHWIVLIEESSKRTPKIQMSIQRTDFWKKKLLLKYGLTYRRYDPDSEQGNEFVVEAKSVSVEPPFLVIMTSEGKPVKTFPFPTGKTSDESIALVEKEL